MATLLLCAGGINALSIQIRCIDAAREAARLAARGDGESAADAVRRVGPDGGSLQIRSEGGFVFARVSGHSRFIPGLHLVGEAVAASEGVVPE